MRTIHFKPFIIMHLSRTATIIAALLAVACAPKAADPIETLKNAAESGKYLYAHQDALCYGHDWNVTDPAIDPADRSDVKFVCSDYPAILGLELGGIEKGKSENLDGVDFGFMLRAAKAQVERGGLLTFSWHADNPVTGGTAWDVSSNEAVASIVEGGANHGMFMGWLSKVADFLEKLDAPVIWRPWHENTASWFWWGRDLCSEQDYKALWQITYDYLVKERGLTKLVWAYSPSDAYLLSDAIPRYPGDEIIDIIGVDRYCNQTQEEIDGFIAGMQADLSFLEEFANQHGLLLAVTETGQEGISYKKWWTKALQPAIKGHPVSYVLTWRNAWNRPGHFYGPWKGAECEIDFRDFYRSEETVFLKDLKK